MELLQRAGKPALPGLRKGRSPAEQGHVEGTFTQFPSHALVLSQKLAKRWWEHAGGVAHGGVMGSCELWHSPSLACECDMASTEPQPRVGDC